MTDSLEIAYQSEMVTVYHGRAEALPNVLERGAVDLIATDPPYGVNWRSNLGKNFDHIQGDDGSLDVAAILESIMRAGLRPFRHIYYFGPKLEGMSLGGLADLVWDKNQIGPGDLASPWGPMHEGINFGMFIPSKANRDRGSGGLAAKMRQGSVIREQRPNSRGVVRHPTEKPVRLMARLIESSSCLDEIVLDPFAGSGSTLVAAIITGRRAIGVESDAQYVPVMIDRVKRAEAAMAGRYQL